MEVEIVAEIKSLQGKVFRQWRGGACRVLGVDFGTDRLKVLYSSVQDGVGLISLHIPTRKVKVGEKEVVRMRNEYYLLRISFTQKYGSYVDYLILEQMDGQTATKGTWQRIRKQHREAIEQDGHSSSLA